MSTIKVINAIHPTGSTNNIVLDNAGNVAVGNNVTVAGTATVSGAATVTGNLTVTSSTATVGGVQVVAVAPGTNGNVLTSNGTTWVSSAPASGGVTSLTAGNGITVSASTGAVTVSQDIYTGSSSTNTSYPIGTCLFVRFDNNTVVADSSTIRLQTTSSNWGFTNGNNGFPSLTGTWRSRGYYDYSGSGDRIGVYQRTA